jgi:hypothetical protein
MLFKNSWTAGKKCGGAPSCMNLCLQIHILQQLWKEVSKEVMVKGPSQVWWNTVWSHKSVYHSACMENQAEHIEHFLSWPGRHKSDTVLQKSTLLQYFVSCVL